MGCLLFCVQSQQKNALIFICRSHAIKQPFNLQDGFVCQIAARKSRMPNVFKAPLFLSFSRSSKSNLFPSGSDEKSELKFSPSTIKPDSLILIKVGRAKPWEAGNWCFSPLLNSSWIRALMNISSQEVKWSETPFVSSVFPLRIVKRKFLFQIKPCEFMMDRSVEKFIQICG